MRTSHTVDMQDGYDLNDPVQWGQFVAMQAARRMARSSVNASGATVGSTKGIGDVISRHNNRKVKGVVLSDAEVSGIWMSSFILDEVMTSEFVQDYPITEIVLQLELSDNYDRKIWGNRGSSTVVWVGFSEFYKMYSTALVGHFESATMSYYSNFTQIKALLSVSTWDRLEGGVARTEDVGNVDMPTYGVGKKDSFLATLFTLVFLPIISVKVLDKTLGMGGIAEETAFVIDEASLKTIRDAWYNVKDRSKFGLLDTYASAALNSKPAFEAIVNKIVQSFS